MSKGFWALVLTTASVLLMPSPAQASWPREGYSDIGNGIECKLLSGHREWSCWLNDVELYVECFEYPDYDNSTTTVECNVYFAPGTVHSPLAERDRQRVAEAISNGGHANLPGWSSPPLAPAPTHPQTAPPSGSDGTGC